VHRAPSRRADDDDDDDDDDGDGDGDACTRARRRGAPSSVHARNAALIIAGLPVAAFQNGGLSSNLHVARWRALIRPHRRPERRSRSSARIRSIPRISRARCVRSARNYARTGAPLPDYRALPASPRDAARWRIVRVSRAALRIPQCPR